MSKASTSKEDQFRADLSAAMEATMDKASSWYGDEKHSRVIDEAVRRGFAHRPSHSQAEWTEQGIEWVKQSEERSSPHIPLIPHNARRESFPCHPSAVNVANLPSKKSGNRTYVYMIGRVAVVLRGSRLNCLCRARKIAFDHGYRTISCIPAIDAD